MVFYILQIVKKVSEKFSAYMKEVGCAGEVRLYTAGADKNDDEDNLRYNFKDWGVEILVKFREASSLQVLSAQTHSGGERSVSTIMYLMGLQNLMASPFRCVDEINQGLDERNERLVFKRIVENSTIPASASSNSDHCGQYFLITPKLLPNLDGMENENIYDDVIMMFGETNSVHPSSLPMLLLCLASLVHHSNHMIKIIDENPGHILRSVLILNNPEKLSKLKELVTL